MLDMRTKPKWSGEEARRELHVGVQVATEMANALRFNGRGDSRHGVLADYLATTAQAMSADAGPEPEGFEPTKEERSRVGVQLRQSLVALVAAATGERAARRFVEKALAAKGMPS